MEQKRSGTGIAARILYIIPLLNYVMRLVLMVRDAPQLFAWPELLHRIPDVMGLCQMVFIIISLFRERRSWLLLTAFILMDLQMVWELAVSGINFEFSVYFAINVLNYATALLTTAMVYVCVPSHREHADWTGKVWFLPAVCNVVMNVIYLVIRYENYLDMLEYNPIVLFIGNMLLFPVMAAWYLLFGLWLTEPIRKKKTV